MAQALPESLSSLRPTLIFRCSEHLCHIYLKSSDGVVLYLLSALIKTKVRYVSGLPR